MQVATDDSAQSFHNVGCCCSSSMPVSWLTWQAEGQVPLAADAPRACGSHHDLKGTLWAQSSHFGWLSMVTACGRPLCEGRGVQIAVRANSLF
jgi:hypothetical protein